MSLQRNRRVAVSIKEEVSDILRNGIKDPGLVKMTSVTSVDLTRDLSYAKIYVSIFGNNEEQENILKILDRAAGFVRMELGKRIRLRHIPELEFRLDNSMDYGAHFDNVLRTLNTGSRDEKGNE